MDIRILTDNPKRRNALRQMLLDEGFAPAAIGAGGIPDRLFENGLTEADPSLADETHPEHPPVVLIVPENAHGNGVDLLRRGVQDVLDRGGFSAGGLARTVRHAICRHDHRQSIHRESDRRNEGDRPAPSKEVEKLDALHESDLHAQYIRNRRLASELHDGVAQLLVGLRMNLDLLEGAADPGQREFLVETFRNVIDDTVRSVRRVIFDLTPADLYTEGLPAAARSLARTLRESHGLDVSIEDDGRVPPLRDEWAHRMFGILNELLKNVRNHAGARTAMVEMARKDGAFVMTVRDYGAGFDPSTIEGRTDTSGGNGHSDGSGDDGRSDGGGFGLYRIRQTLERVGGSLAVDARPGKGATIAVRLPLTEETTP